MFLAEVAAELLTRVDETIKTATISRSFPGLLTPGGMLQLAYSVLIVLMIADMNEATKITSSITGSRLKNAISRI